MRKIVIFGLIFLLMVSSSYASFCCKDPDTGQSKCYQSGYGECCGGIWYSSCYDFEISTVGTSVFRIGQKTPVIVYIKNIGGYTDSFVIEAISSDSRILVDMTDADSVTVSPGQIKKVYPKITVLAPIVGTVTFRATSSKPDVKTAILQITESDSYLSLPEFSLLGMLQLMLLIGIIYLFSRQRYF